MISILLNSRNKDYENPGNVTQFLESLYRSIYNKKNVEVIFKFDIDDEISTNQFLNCVTTYPDLQLKCIITPRYYYKGLHLGYYECFKLIDDKSKIIICMADDFLFTETNWDTELLNVTSKFTKNDIYTIQNFIGTCSDHVPISPMWSPKIIEICKGFGPVFATDAWALKINQLLQKMLPENIIIYNIGVSRKTCAMDYSSHPRWDTDRFEALNFLNTQEFKNIIDEQYVKLINYINSQTL